jgi:alpha-tubulin suppressor-like RCC1 family protein
LASTPQPVTLGPDRLNGIEAIAIGRYHTCALMNDGTVRCWGDNMYGQLGTGAPGPPSTVPASPVTFGQPLGGVREIAAGGDHTCALMNDGTVQCWGFNNTGELGATTGRNCAGQLGGFPCSASPVAVAITDANGNPAPVLHIAAGYSHTCAAPLGGGIKCWGNNLYDQLGASTAPASPAESVVPLAVDGLNTRSILMTSCDGRCTDTTTDPQNCGRCNKACIGGTCIAGACMCPLANPTLCPAQGSSQLCTDVMSDSSNCGRCGVHCTARECSAGQCRGCPTTCVGGCPRGSNCCPDDSGCARCVRHECF